MALLLGIALAIAQIANFALILGERQKLSLAQDDGPAITRFAGATADVAEADPMFRQALVGDLSHRGARFALQSASGIIDANRDNAIEVRLADNLHNLGHDGLAIRAVSPHPLQPPTGATHQGERYGLTLAVRLPDGKWLVGTLPTPRREPWFAARLAAATLLLYVLVLVATIVIARHIAWPLRDLTRAAQQFRGRTAPIAVEPRGPDDLRDAIEAFNAMNRRLVDLLDEKDGMLGAIGHDLRTPLASLRIRLENMEPPEEREAAVRKLEELATMLEDMLALATSGRQREAVRPADIGALVETVVEEYQDLGRSVSWSPSARHVLPVQPNQLKRAVQNLVDNALKYGTSAAVSVTSAPGAVRIEVADEGPGIPPDQIESVLRPFYRLESSRNRETGGTGLGLAIAKAVAESHGGSLMLENALPGLRATLSLPA